ncbi:MAG: type I polyketide synthase [Pseudomonadota bacterium]
MGRTGVYVGASAMDHAQRFASDVAAIDSPFMTGNSLSVLANRISYLLDLDGPSLTVDTACASGLTALHLAAGALARGEIDTAVVAGVNLLLQPFSFVGFSQAGMLSRQGLCRAFDAGADGYVRAEGGVGLVLRRVADAREGGEPVRSRLLGTGTASGGRSTGLTTPSQAAQAALITEVHARIGLAADALGFLEAHGTGTPVGDPIEAAAIGEALGRHRSTPLPIGSAKTNIGHLEPAAGLAGLLKAQLALEHGRYPASLHVETVNPAIDEDALNLRVARDAVALPERPGGAVWTAAVNAFGFGGANAHAVIEAVPWREVAGDGPLPPLLLTAASEKALAAMASDWRSRFLAEPSPALPDAASAAGHRRARLGRRAVLRAADAEALEAGLTALAAGRDAPGLVTGDAVEEGPVGFVFSGNGSQWAGMGADLRRTDPVFSDAYARVAALFRDSGGADLAELDRLEGEAAEDALRDSETGQAALLALQVGLVESLAAAGLTPGIVAGHSVGEVAAAWSAGALSLEDAVLLVVRRSRTVREIRGDGGMAAMLADADRAQSLIDGLALSDHLTLAADNSPRSVTISGEGAALDALAKGAKRARLPLRRLPVDYAYHSAVLESGRNGLIADLAELTPAEAAVPFVSATDAALRPGETLDGTYWYRNARERVRFREALLAMAEQGCRLFLEIGPRPVLASYARDTLANTPWRTVCLGSLEGPGRAPRDAGAIVAAALAHGARPDPERVFGPRRPVPARLPAYPWQRHRLRAGRKPEAVDVFGREPGHPLLGARDRPGVGPWHNLIDTEVLPWLADHRVDSVPVLPATAYIEMALAVGRAELGPCPLELRDFDIVASLPLPDGQTMALRTSFDKETGLLRIESRPHCRDVAWTLHARGTLRDAAAESETLSDAAPDRTIDATDISSLYGGLSALGLDYGPTFRRVARLEATGSRSIAAKLRALEPAEDGEMHCHPAMLDAALHGLASLLPSHAPEEEPGSRRPFVPAHIGRLHYFPSEEAPSLQCAELTLVHASEVGAEVRLRLGDTSGAAQLVLDGLRLQPLHGPQRAVVPTLWDEALEPVRLPAEAVRLPTVWADPAARLGELGLASADGSMETTDDAAWLLLDELARIAAAEAVAVGIARHGPLPADGGERIAAQSRALFDALSRFLLADGALQLEDGRFNMAARSPYEPAAALVQALRCEAAEHASDLLALLDESETLAARLFDAGEPAARVPGIDAPRYRALWNRLATAALDMAKTWPDGERLAILVLGAPPPAFRSELTGCASIGEIVQADPRDQGGAFVRSSRGHGASTSYSRIAGPWTRSIRPR